MESEFEEGSDEYGLVLPFLTDDPMFAHGVEIGMLYMEMKEGEPINGLYHMANQEQILLMANRAGYKVQGIKDVDEYWFAIHAEKPMQAEGA